MTSLYTFLPNWSKLNVYSLFYGILSPSFTTLVPETVCVEELKSIFRNFRYFRHFHYFNGQICNERPICGHIRFQRLQINIQQFSFFFSFANFGFNGFSVFSTAILDRRYEPKTLICNPIQSDELKELTYQFEENSTKNEEVRVPH